MALRWCVAGTETLHPLDIGVPIGYNPSTMAALKQRIILVVACAAFGLCAASPKLTGGLQFGTMSQVPRFARINLTDAGDKWLLVVFDESGGTGAGYDFVHLVPQGFSAATLSTKAAKGKHAPGTASTGPAVCSPMKIADHVAAAGVRRGAAQYLSAVAFVCSASSSFSAQLQYRARVNGVNWEYRLDLPVGTSADDSKVPAVSVEVRPALTLELKPVGTSNELAFGIFAATAPGSCTANGVPPELSVVVKATNGTVVKRVTSTADQFGTNATGSCLCVVPVPRRGAYTVEATMDMGPLCGEMKATKHAEVPISRDAKGTADPPASTPRP